MSALRPVKARTYVSVVTFSVTDCPTLHLTWIDIYKHQQAFSEPPKRFGTTSSVSSRSEAMKSFRVRLSFRKEMQRFFLRTPG